MKNIRIKDGFGMVSNTVIRDPEVSLRDKTIYAHLCTYADAKANSCTVSIDRIAAECGVDQSTVKRSLASLIKKGIISRTMRGINTTALTILIK